MASCVALVSHGLSKYKYDIAVCCWLNMDYELFVPNILSDH